MTGASRSGMTASKRGATINIEQLPNGYWHADLTIHIPGAQVFTTGTDLMHDGGECLDWARSEIARHVSDYTWWWTR